MTAPAAIFQVGHLERVPLGTPYPGIVARVGGLLEQLPARTELVIDITGVGKPVFEMFTHAGISPLGVLITAGTTEDAGGCDLQRAEIDARLAAAGLAARGPAENPQGAAGSRDLGPRAAGFPC